ncbi:MAG: hypothetical protein KGJ36_04665 [Acidobacteriota bacterium]|nr:hypothetical protein [Acidobacteriota bacterium]
MPEGDVVHTVVTVTGTVVGGAVVGGGGAVVGGGGAVVGGVVTVAPDTGARGVLVGTPARCRGVVDTVVWVLAPGAARGAVVVVVGGADVGVVVAVLVGLAAWAT